MLEQASQKTSISKDLPVCFYFLNANCHEVIFFFLFPLCGQEVASRKKVSRVSPLTSGLEKFPRPVPGYNPDRHNIAQP